MRRQATRKCQRSLYSITKAQTDMICRKRRRSSVDPKQKPDKRARRDYSHITLERLSNELLILILGFLPAPDLLRCQTLNRRFGALAIEPSLWEQLYHRDNPTTKRGRREELSGLRRRRSFGQIVAQDAAPRGLTWKKRYQVRSNWKRGRCSVKPIASTTDRSYVSDSWIADFCSQDQSLTVRDRALPKIHGSINLGDQALDITWPAKRRMSIRMARAVVTVSVSRVDGRLDLTLEHELKLTVESVQQTDVHLSCLARNLFCIYELVPSRLQPKLLYTLRGYDLGQHHTILTSSSAHVVTTSIVFMSHAIDHSEINLQEIFIDPAHAQPRLRVAGVIARRAAWNDCAYAYPWLVTSHDDNTLSIYRVCSTDDSLTIEAVDMLVGHSTAVTSCRVDADRVLGLGRAGLHVQSLGGASRMVRPGIADIIEREIASFSYTDVVLRGDLGLVQYDFTK